MLSAARRDAVCKPAGLGHTGGLAGVGHPDAEMRQTAWQSGLCSSSCWGSVTPDFHGEIIAELERLRESGTVRVAMLPLA